MLKRWKKWGLLVLGVLLGVFWVPFSVLAENGEERVAVYVQVPEDWENPCIWAWDEEGNNAFAAWPGEEMDADRWCWRGGIRGLLLRMERMRSFLRIRRRRGIFRSMWKSSWCG